MSQQPQALKVTFRTRTGHQVVEYFDLTPHDNGFVPDYKLRAMALNWTVELVEEERVSK